MFERNGMKTEILNYTIQKSSLMLMCCVHCLFCVVLRLSIVQKQKINQDKCCKRTLTFALSVENMEQYSMEKMFKKKRKNIDERTRIGRIATLVGDEDDVPWANLASRHKSEKLHKVAKKYSNKLMKKESDYNAVARRTTRLLTRPDIEPLPPQFGDNIYFDRDIGGVRRTSDPTNPGPVYNPEPEPVPEPEPDSDLKSEPKTCSELVLELEQFMTDLNERRVKRLASDENNVKVDPRQEMWKNKTTNWSDFDCVNAGYCPRCQSGVSSVTAATRGHVMPTSCDAYSGVNHPLLDASADDGYNSQYALLRPVMNRCMVAGDFGRETEAPAGAGYSNQYALLRPVNGFVNGSKITLTASTSVVHPLLTPNLNVRCVIEDTATSGSIVGKRSVSSDPDIALKSVTTTTDNAKFVLSMFLFRDDQDIASLSEHVPATAVSTARNINVSGQIPGPQGEKGVLEVDMSYPTEGQGGNYTCKVTAIDDVGHSVEYADSVDVDVITPTIHDLLDHIQIQDQKNKDEISALKSEITQLKQEDKDNKAEISSLKTTLNITAHVESGNFTGSYVGSSYTMWRTQSVNFTRPYITAPMVHVALMDIGVHKDYHGYIHVKLLNTDTHGFTVEWKTDGSAYFLQYVTLSWLSFPRL